MSELSPMDESLRQHQAEITRAAAERAVIAAAKKLGPSIERYASSYQQWHIKDGSADGEPHLSTYIGYDDLVFLRAALSALAALETPNDTKETT